jgi:Rad/Gem-related GTP binding protein 1
MNDLCKHYIYFIQSIADGKTMATRYDVKYTEVSAVLNHKVDDLLAGILQQIRLKERRQHKLRRKAAKRWAREHQLQQQPLSQPTSTPAVGSSSSSGCLHFPTPRGLVGKLLRRHPMFRSCDNLLVS